MTRSLSLLSLAFLAACPGGGATDDTGAPTGEFAGLSFVELDVEDGLEHVTDFDFLPDGSILAATMGGEVVHVTLDGDEAVTGARFAVPDGSSGLDGCGLISIAVDPDYSTNSLVWVGVCESETSTSIERLTLDPTDMASTEVALVWRVEEPTAENAWHQFGSLGFDDSGVLFSGLGEMTRPANAADESNAKGALVRILPDRTPEGSGYTIPEGNAGFAAPEIYAKGLRSPWKTAIDPTGAYWIADVGNNSFEELNRAAEPGLDFGWNASEGPCTSDCEGQTDPITAWEHSNDHPYVTDDRDAVATSRLVGWVADLSSRGGPDPYDGHLDGGVVFGDMCRGWIRWLGMSDDAVASDVHIGHLPDVTGMRRSPDGHVYMGTFGQCLARGEPYPWGLFRAEPEYE